MNAKEAHDLAEYARKIVITLEEAAYLSDIHKGIEVAAEKGQMYFEFRFPPEATQEQVIRCAKSLKEEMFRVEDYHHSIIGIDWMCVT